VKRLYKELLLILFLVLVFFIGFFLVFINRGRQARKQREDSFEAKESTFLLEPPAGSLIGKIATSSGKVVKQSRNEDVFRDIDVVEKIIKGERLATYGESGLVVEFLGFAEIELEENTEVELVSARPDNFLIDQKSGGLNVKVIGENKVSVRSIDVLIVFDKGRGDININNELITVDVFEGRAVIGFVDLTDEALVYEIEGGQAAQINSLYRWVKVF
jgi:hypothetical protein